MNTNDTQSVYKCEPCIYSTHKLFNYNRHMSSKSHEETIRTLKAQKNRTKVQNIKDSVQKNRAINSEPSSPVKCQYCSKSICRSKNLKDHYERCKEKAKYDIKDNFKDHFESTVNEMKNRCKEVEEECNRLRNELYAKNNELDAKQKELNAKEMQLDSVKKEKHNMEERNNQTLDKLFEYLDYDKKNRLNQTIINNITNNVKLDIKYIDRNCTNPIDYKETMAIPFTDEEKQMLMQESHIEGPRRILHDRCIKDIPFDKRCMHLLDDSRNKYYVYYDGSWKIDKDGEEILKTALAKVNAFYLGDYKDAKTDEILRRNKKVSELYKDRYDILKYLHEDILLKNNEKLMRKALKLISS